jgi:hypothetical protein
VARPASTFLGQPHSLVPVLWLTGGQQIKRAAEQRLGIAVLAGEFKRFESQGACLCWLTYCQERMREEEVSVNEFDAVRIRLATSTLCPDAVLTDAWGEVARAPGVCADGEQTVEGETTCAERPAAVS